MNSLDVGLTDHSSRQHSATLGGECGGQRGGQRDRDAAPKPARTSLRKLSTNCSEASSVGQFIANDPGDRLGAVAGHLPDGQGV
jgi:hypothetical protein